MTVNLRLHESPYASVAPGVQVLLTNRSSDQAVGMAGTFSRRGRASVRGGAMAVTQRLSVRRGGIPTAQRALQRSKVSASRRPPAFHANPQLTI